MIAIIDYGIGNLRSVQKAFEYVGLSAILTSDITKIKDASHIVLPGVGAFNDALTKLDEYNMCDVILAEIKKGKAFLGICLGMQLLFEKSTENGEHSGFGIMEGEVVPIITQALPVPHMCWNKLDIKANLLINTPNQFVYFTHSYCIKESKHAIAYTTYEEEFVSAVNKDNIYGTQFHPEKSGEVGLKMLKNFGGISL